MRTFRKAGEIVRTLINRVVVISIKLSSVIVSFSFILILLLAIGVTFADYQYADNFYSYYFTKQAFQNGLDGFILLCYLYEKQKIIAIVVVTMFIIGLFALKYLLRKYWTKELRKHNILTNSAYLLSNLFISIIIIVIIYISIMTFAVTSYMEIAISENDTVESLSFSERTNYIRELTKNNYFIGNAALQKVIYDFENNPDYLNNYSLEKHLEFCFEINRLIELIDGPQTAEEHYLRNYLNYGPPSLNDMIEEIKNNSPMKWKLLSPDQSVFHMNGEDGEYNLKFISKNGFFEAVYNIDGVLLTKTNDPVNMGTYNYADPILEPNKHSIYDIIPYFQWGNLSPSDMHPDETAIDRYSLNTDAVERYEKIRTETENYYH